MKKLLLFITVLLITLSLTACFPEDKADVVSENISTGADNFEILRKVVFYNVITGEYMYVIEGHCSIEADMLDEQLEVTCKIGDGQYVKNYLGISDNVSYMVLQLETANVSAYHYRVILRPQAIIPDIELDLE